MEIFQCFRGHDLLTNEFSINGFQKPLQLTEIIVELPFMWKLSSIYCKYANYLRKLRGSYYKIRLLFHYKCGQPLTIQNFHNFQKVSTQCLCVCGLFPCLPARILTCFHHQENMAQHYHLYMSITWVTCLCEWHVCVT